MYATTKIIDNGFAKLERFLKDRALYNLPPRRQVHSFDEIINFEVKGPEVVIFDGRADWFSTMWHINRYNFYYSTPIVHFSDFLLLQERYGDPFAYLKRGGVRSFWFVLTAEDGIVGNPGSEGYQQSLQTLLRSIQEGGVGPATEITNGYGKVIFRVYHFSTAG